MTSLVRFLGPPAVMVAWRRVLTALGREPTGPVFTGRGVRFDVVLGAGDVYAVLLALTMDYEPRGVTHQVIKEARP